MRALVVACLLAWASVLRAQPADDVAARIAHIDAVLRAERPASIAWTAGWLAYSAAEGGYAVYAFRHARARFARDVWGVTWAGSAALALELAHNLGPHTPPARRRRVVRDSLLDLVWTVAVTELAIWTQPTGVLRARAQLVVGPRQLGIAARF